MAFQKKVGYLFFERDQHKEIGHIFGLSLGTYFGSLESLDLNPDLDLLDSMNLDPQHYSLLSDQLLQQAPVRDQISLFLEIRAVIKQQF